MNPLSQCALNKQSKLGQEKCKLTLRPKETYFFDKFVTICYSHQNLLKKMSKFSTTNIV